MVFVGFVKGILEKLKANKLESLVIAAVMVGALIMQAHYLGSESLWPDESLYMWVAHRVAEEPSLLFGEMAFEFAWYFPLLIMAFFNLFASAIVAGKLMSMFFSLWGILSAFLIGKEIRGLKTGIIAAIFLAVSPHYWFFSTRALLDVPLTAMFLATVYALLMYERRRSRKWAVWLGVVATLTAFTKVSGLFIYPAIALYFIIIYGILPLFRKRVPAFKGRTETLRDLISRNELRYGLLVGLVGIGIFFANELLHSGSLLTSHHASSALKGSIFTGSYLYYLEALPSMISWFLIVLLIVGSYLAYVRLKKGSDFNTWFYIFVSVVVSYGFVLSFIVGEKVPRYFLPAIPFFMLGSAFVLSKLMRGSKYWRGFLVVFSFIIVLSLFLSGKSLIESRSKSYTGFVEAGEKIKAAAGNETPIIIAGSLRSIRLTSGFEYEKWGGTLIKFPDDKGEFEDIAKENKTIILETDVWEYTQPPYIMMKKEGRLNIDYLVGLGFAPVHVVRRNNAPVIIVMKKAGS